MYVYFDFNSKQQAINKMRDEIRDRDCNPIESQLHAKIASRLSVGTIIKLTGPDHRGRRR